MIPPIVLLPALTHFVWFVPGASLKSFWIVDPFFHSLQYLLVALAMQLKVSIDVAGGEIGLFKLMNQFEIRRKRSLSDNKTLR